MTSNAILDVNHIWKKIGHHVIINDVSLKLYEGDILGFIGANGAGKTTFIKLILGLQSFNGGSVMINGYPIKKDFEKAIYHVGAVVETPDLYMYMSGYDHLRMEASIYNIGEDRIQEVIQIIGLKEKIYDKVKKYSLGMRERLGIGIAILHQPKLLILDEPMNGLDPEGIRDLKELIRDLAYKEHMAILISSHILSELENLCNRICILSKGHIVRDDSIDKIKTITDRVSYVMELSNTSLNQIIYLYEKIDDSHIRVKTTKDGLNTIIKTLLLNDISIYEIKRDDVSLEDIFLEATKENIHE